MNDNPLKRHRQSTQVLSRLELNLTVSVSLALIAVLALGISPGGIANQADVTTLKPSTTSTWPAVLGTLGFIGLNAIFVLAETAVSLLRSTHLKQLKAELPARQRLSDLIERQASIVAAFSFGTQVLRVGLLFMGFILAFGFAKYCESVNLLAFSTSSILLCAVVVSIPIIVLNLVLGELVPKSFAALHPNKVSVILYPFIRTVSAIFAFPAAGVVNIANLFARRFGGTASLDGGNRAEEEIINLVESAEETGEIESDESELIQSVFEFNDTVAREVMTPRVDLDAMPINSDPALVVEVIQKSGHSRIPLFQETDDQIVGIIHAKDLLMAMVGGQSVSLRRLMRPVVFVPESMNLHDLLAELKAAKTQLAIVQDEQGGTAGIVTIEDIVEELVGDIQDEYDVEEPEVAETASGFLVDGKTHLDDVNDEVGSAIESEDFDTIGGFVFGLFGRQPKLGEFIEHDGFKFTIVETDGRRILKLRIQKLEAPNDLAVLSAEEARPSA